MRIGSKMKENGDDDGAGERGERENTDICFQFGKLSILAKSMVEIFYLNPLCDMILGL